MIIAGLAAAVFLLTSVAIAVIFLNFHSLDPGFPFSNRTLSRSILGGNPHILHKYRPYQKVLHTSEYDMGDKSCYMGAGGYSAPTATVNAGSGYTREEYAYGGSSSSNGSNTQNQTTQPSQQVFKPRTDQSCYLGPQ